LSGTSLQDLALARAVVGREMVARMIGVIGSFWLPRLADERRLLAEAGRTSSFCEPLAAKLYLSLVRLPDVDPAVCGLEAEAVVGLDPLFTFLNPSEFLCSQLSLLTCIPGKLGISPEMFNDMFILASNNRQF